MKNKSLPWVEEGAGKISSPFSLGPVTNMLDLVFPGSRKFPRAIPITQKRGGTYFLVGLTFETAAEAEKFAEGLSDFCDRTGERVFLKKPPPVGRDEKGNCFGLN